MHKFEASGLGAAPYTFVCVAETPGARCNYCRQRIRYTYWFRSSDAKIFKVGSDCFFAAHAGENTRPGTAARDLFKRVKKARTAFMKKLRDDALAADMKLIRHKMADYPDFLADKPHPRPFPAALGKTLRDHVVSVFDAGTVAERIKVCKIVGALA